MVPAPTVDSGKEVGDASAWIHRSSILRHANIAASEHGQRTIRTQIKVILGGMLANMRVESYLRELLEQGFEVAVAKDATAAPIRSGAMAIRQR